MSSYIAKNNNESMTKEEYYKKKERSKKVFENLKKNLYKNVDRLEME